LKKLVACAFVFGGFAASAQAADLGVGSLKDPLPDTLTYKGVTVYGALDVGYAYQTHGARLSGASGSAMQYNMFSASSSNKPISTLAPNGLSQSFVGVKVEESIGMGWTVLAKAESGFQPLSGELADGCASQQRQNGLNVAQQTASKADSSRCGQFFNGPAYAGVSNAAYGTLTAGRQNSLDLELMGTYDPMASSYAFSLIGISSTAGGGIGATETARWDNSVKYVYQYGPVHAAAMYTDGGGDNAIQTMGIAGGAGITWKGLSVDVVYTHEEGAVGGAAMSAAQCAAIGLTQPACAATKVLSATISDNTAWTVGAKYTVDLGGGWKDDGPGAKFTVFGGYQRVEMENPTDPVKAGSTTINGYVMGAVNNTNFDTAKILQTAWAGAKYELPSGWSFTGAYYHLDQNSWLTGPAIAIKSCATSAKPAVGIAIPANCAGNFNMGSFLVDYAFNKHFDVYAGVNYSTVDGGLSSGFLQTESALFMSGMRLRF
jgi:predicted porin